MWLSITTRRCFSSGCGSTPGAGTSMCRRCGHLFFVFVFVFFLRGLSPSLCSGWVQCCQFHFDYNSPPISCLLQKEKKNSKLLSVIFQADLDRGGVRVKLLKLKVSCLCRVFSRLDLAWLRPLEFYTCTSSLSGCAGGTQAALEF